MKNGGYLMTSQKQQLNEQKMINHLSTVGILGNVILTAFKLLAGIIGHSGAMISLSRRPRLRAEAETEEPGDEVPRSKGPG